MIGRIMIASTTPAVSIVRPVADGGPGEERQEAEVVVQPLWIGTMYGARTRPPHRPNTTDGIAASRSIT